MLLSESPTVLPTPCLVNPLVVWKLYGLGSAVTVRFLAWMSFLVEVENEGAVRSVGNFVVGVDRDAPE